MKVSQSLDALSHLAKVHSRIDLFMKPDDDPHSAVTIIYDNIAYTATDLKA